MVNIVIMRHGEAEPFTEQDSQRQLTAIGKRESLHMAQWLQNCYRSFTYIWLSPYLRTAQTAEIMRSKQGADCQLETQQQLVPEGSVRGMLDAIDARLSEQPDARILLVSHMPLVSFLVEALTQPGQTPVFSTASLCCIDYQPAKGGHIVEKVAPQELVILSS
ncbi:MULTISPECIES: phosphohistidine phosphatase SixA [unclassified Arsukibacterium]|uniref:phosphohistidine phosphatase SixA n=1 Tax=unclassified Arsukibacterium TaxID=2635278 RepID=UPI000C93A9B1|nr:MULTISPECIES: phosphohistidine phosphatase SixA [unclassified Arsukibacterium]MAA96495.1 phosphohistidine phosphatase SixA [Rheinheimera sp.]HAW94197.1 phosphohistidine phosphatase SixA [Candidatus Azambacteria bacterium]|tara:strand:+ start:28996 stop:29484 length:489 start_codon:yes stop_codon:yes gene_type:complete